MDIIRRRSIVLILFLVFLFSTQNYFILSLGMNIICKPSERTALVSFKQHLNDSSNSLSSWSSENCCRCAGVVCSNTTDHVVQLQLHGLGLGGELNPSLLELKQLRHLDLSLNNFDGIRIPDFLGSLQTLRYLNLSYGNFSGMIPHQLGNLSNLCYLDLRSNYRYYPNDVVGNFHWISELTVVGNFQWISHLSSLKYLDLSFVNLENASSNWFHDVVNMLPSLLVLRLSACRLPGALLTSLSHVNFTSLEDLDLSWNTFNSTLPEWLYSLTNLQQLDLSWNSFQGTISPSIGNLTKLTLLSLGNNDFQGTIPASVGNLTKLTLLDLSSNDFEGTIPASVGNLTKLTLLDLSVNKLTKEISGFLGNFQWISHLSSLEHLDLSGMNLENASSNWVHVVNMLPSLLVLRLHDCDLSGALPTSLLHVNFTSLQVLDLSFNSLNSTLPEWLYSLTNLQQLDLRGNSFQGTISASIGNLTKLTLLDLSSNHESNSEGEILVSIENLGKLQRFSGPIPLSIGRLSSLTELDLRGNKLIGSLPESLINLTKLTLLDLSSNQLEGEIPMSIGNLSNLVDLRIDMNAFEGIVSEVHFANLTNLQHLFMDSHSLVLKVSPEWIPPFQLLVAYLGSCQLGPGFPIWLRTQKSLIYLGLSRTGISGSIPTWFWNLPSQNSQSIFDLSYNDLHGELPKVISFAVLNLKSNQFSGQLPRVTSDVLALVLSNNSFSGPISTFLCNPPTSENNYLGVLDLSDNLLSGNLSECWVYWRYLEMLNLGGNKITGKIPSSMGSLLELQVLHLGNNSLSGELPSSLRNRTSLRSIDLRENGFTGRLPIWLGESPLEYLLLGSNKFYGEIPLEFCHLASIHVLDISHNDLRGSIPRCFNNFSELTTKHSSDYEISWNVLGEDVEKTRLVVKGRELEYSSIDRALVTSLDLSKNNLSGEIPEELTSLVGLMQLILSDNSFTGKIPKNIGNMISLESLDLSRNRISGVIPQSISGLSFLSVLNLSYNNLSGEIPQTTQLQGFTNLSFIGNQELCGLPLKSCNEDEPSKEPGDIGDRADEDEDWFEMKWFYMSMGVGFVFGFWVFCGVLVLKKSWRFAYFQFLDDMKDKLCTLL